MRYSKTISFSSDLSEEPERVRIKKRVGQLLDGDDCLIDVTLIGEDHTFGCAFQNHASKLSEVAFVGYKEPHPHFQFIVITLKTHPGNDPVEIFRRVCEEIAHDFAFMENQWKRQCKKLMFD